MESKRVKDVKNSNIFLFGLSFNLILTVASLGFTCYSLHRLESRVTTVEQDLPYRLDNHEIFKPSSTHSPPNEDKRRNLVKRAVDGSSKCRECNSVCLNSNGSRKVRRFLVRVTSSRFRSIMYLKYLWF